MDLQNLKDHHEELLSFMENNGYSSTYIRRFREEINRILAKADSHDWQSYRDVYLDYLKAPHSKDYLRNKRTIIGALEQFDDFGRMPDGRSRHLMDMAKTSGTLEKLNEIYDRELEHMQGIIDDLKAQVKTWKNKVLHYDKFLNVKGLVEEFKEFARPKSIKERMEDKLKNVKTQKQEMKPVQRRKKDLAI